jgi:hypothetical protein
MILVLQLIGLVFSIRMYKFNKALGIYFSLFWILTLTYWLAYATVLSITLMNPAIHVSSVILVIAMLKLAEHEGSVTK